MNGLRLVFEHQRGMVGLVGQVALVSISLGTVYRPKAHMNIRHGLGLKLLCSITDIQKAGIPGIDSRGGVYQDRSTHGPAL